MVYTTRLTAHVVGFRDDINRLLDGAVERDQYAGWTPAVDVSETNEALTFAVEIPGLTQKDVDVTAENGVLTIRGRRTKTWKEGEEGRFHLAERNHGPFMRHFQLPLGVDTTKIEALVECGLLEVRVPSAALPQPTKIRIHGAVEPSVAVPRALPRGESAVQSATTNGGSRPPNGKHRQK